MSDLERIFHTRLQASGDSRLHVVLAMRLSRNPLDRRLRGIVSPNGEMLHSGAVKIRNTFSGPLEPAFSLSGIPVAGCASSTRLYEASVRSVRHTSNLQPRDEGSLLP